MNDSPQVAGYVYVTRSLEGEPGLTPADQRARIEQLAAARGWTVTEICEDTGAGAGERRGLTRLLDDLAGVDKLLVTRLGRLGITARRLHHAVTRLQESGTDLVAIEDDLELKAGDGAALGKMLALLAEWQPDRGASAAWTKEEMERRGFAPATVIDVGAARGTPLLYRAFPRAYHVMIEPLEEYEPELRHLLEQRKGELVPQAIGSEEGTVTLNVNPACLLETSANTVPGMEAVEREVPMTTLDALLAERDWTPPFAIKIDTEGFEHRVIEGATAVLAQTQLVIAEVSVARRFEGSYTFAEFVALMDARGFELCDVVDVLKPPGGDVRYMDCVFRNTRASE